MFDPESGHHISGTGVCIVHMHNGMVPTVLLFVDTAKGTANDAGGCIDAADFVFVDGTFCPSKTVRAAAARELREESCNLVCISGDMLCDENSVDVRSGHCYYRIFVLRIDGIARRHFFANRKTLKQNSAPFHFLEMKALLQVPLANLTVNPASRLLEGKDIDDVPFVVGGRFARAFLGNSLVFFSVVAEKNLRAVVPMPNSGHRFLQGTVSYAFAKQI